MESENFGFWISDFGYKQGIKDHFSVVKSTIHNPKPALEIRQYSFGINVGKLPERWIPVRWGQIRPTASRK